MNGQQVSTPRRAAAVRTGLLHRMLLIRHLAEHGVAFPLAGAAVHLRVGEEAVAAGLWCVLEPVDIMVRGRSPIAAAGQDGVIVCLVGDGHAAEAAEWFAEARRRRQPVLLCREHCRWTVPPLPVGGRDVEAVMVEARNGLRAARVHGTHVLDFVIGTATRGRDPVTVLADRMYADHQLDDAGLRAIDADAVRVAAAIGGPHRRGPGRARPGSASRPPLAAGRDARARWKETSPGGGPCPTSPQ